MMLGSLDLWSVNSSLPALYCRHFSILIQLLLIIIIMTNRLHILIVLSFTSVFSDLYESL